MADDDVPLHRDRDSQVDWGRLRRQAEWVDVGRRVWKGEDDGIEEGAPSVIGDVIVALVVVGQDVVCETRKSAHQNGTDDYYYIDGSHWDLKQKKLD